MGACEKEKPGSEESIGALKREAMAALVRVVGFTGSGWIGQKPRYRLVGWLVVSSGGG